MPQERRSNPRSRIETLSDLIFGLALSIGALTLIGKPPTTATDVRGDVVGFAFSFLILISVWLRYTRIMSVLPMETGTTVFLNIVLLFLVSIEPYLLSLVLSYGQAVLEYASVLYALDLAGLMAILALFTHMLISEEKKLIKRELISHQRRARNTLFLTAALFLISALPQFWSWTFQGTPLRVYLWYVPLALFWSRGLIQAGRRITSN